MSTASEWHRVHDEALANGSDRPSAVQLADRETCAHPKARIEFVGDWDPDPYYRFLFCPACRSRLQAWDSNGNEVSL